MDPEKGPKNINATPNETVDQEDKSLDQIDTMGGPPEPVKPKTKLQQM